MDVVVVIVIWMSWDYIGFSVVVVAFFFLLILNNGSYGFFRIISYWPTKVVFFSPISYSVPPEIKMRMMKPIY